MHITREKITTKIPIQRKGTKYVARAASHTNDSVPVIIAVRDMLKLARTAKDVKEMIKEKLLKINNRIVIDYHESIKLFNVFEAGKTYKLSILPTGKFYLEELKGKHETRICKVIGKKLIEKGLIQLNLHDGTNIVIPAKDKIMTHDSVEIDFSNKLKKHIVLEKGANVFIISGKYVGLKGKVEDASQANVKIKLKDADKTTHLPKSEVIAT